jgi:hypothetical protein
MAALTYIDIERVLHVAVQLGLKSIKNGDAPDYSNSTVSENFLTSLIKFAMTQCGFDSTLVEHHGGHSFPDVTIKNSQIGIELKGAISAHKFNGNSVVGSTMKLSLTKIYLFYWIGKEGNVGFRDYFECVAFPVVTHSPRFQLDINLEPGMSMFGDGAGKVGKADEVIFRGQKGMDSDKIISWMAVQARARNQTPWWIDSDESLPTGSTGLRQFRDLSQNEKKLFLKKAFLLFPELFRKTSPTKYDRVSAWAITFNDVLIKRDLFSAGGQVPIVLQADKNTTYMLPQVIKRGIDALNSSGTLYFDEVSTALDIQCKTWDEYLNFFESKLQVNLSYVYESLPYEQANSTSKAQFMNNLARLLRGSIDEGSLKLKR